MNRKIFVLSMILLVPIFAQSYLSVHGEDIEVRVDTANGYFGIGTYPDGQRLTYDFGDTILPSSNFVLRLNYSDTYGLCSLETDYALEDYYSTDSPRIIDSTNTIVNTWILPFGSSDFKIEQFLTPVEHGGNEYIKTHLLIINNTSAEYIFELEYKWNICLNDRESTSPNDTNLVYSFSGVPNDFAFFEYVVPDSGLIGIMILGNLDATRSFFAFGDEDEILPSVFDIDPSFSGVSFDRTAALLRWGPIVVSPDDSFDIITYYGRMKNRRTMTYYEGWNLTSRPIYSSYDTVIAYAWDNPAGDYYVTHFIEGGVGYWQMMTDSFWRYIFGDLESYRGDLYRGWNLIGAINKAVPRSELTTTPPGLIFDVYGWDARSCSYIPNPDSLLPGRGYWVLSSGDGEIILGP